MLLLHFLALILWKREVVRQRYVLIRLAYFVLPSAMKYSISFAYPTSYGVFVLPRMFFLPYMMNEQADRFRHCQSRVPFLLPYILQIVRALRIPQRGYDFWSVGDIDL